MGTRARGLLLFSFAFSSVLSSPGIAVPSNEKQTSLKASSKDSTNTSINLAINRGCFNGGSCTRDHSSFDNIEKREISYSQDNKKEEELNKALEMFEPETEESYSARMNRLMNNDIEKKARLGFTGMRGKKDSYISRNYADKGTRREEEEDEDLNGFLEMLERGYAKEFPGIRRQAFEGRREQVSNFHGVGGKKFDDYDNYEEAPFDEYALPQVLINENLPDEGIETLEKRTMPFLGMRGRRDEKPFLVKSFSFPFDATDRDDSGFDFKKGIREKKTPENWENIGKRATVQSRFFGMKGKKAQSGFFGMRGKKNLADILTTNEDRESLVNGVNRISLLNQSDSTQERVRRATNRFRNSKKAKSAFFAVRGKKSSQYESKMNFIPRLE